jgi:hypothetical protein
MGIDDESSNEILHVSADIAGYGEKALKQFPGLDKPWRLLRAALLKESGPPALPPRIIIKRKAE